MNANTRIIPRCPRCNKKQANWIEGNAYFTCDRCQTEFEIRDGNVFIKTALDFSHKKVYVLDNT